MNTPAQTVTVSTPHGGPLPAELEAAFRGYETALMHDDLAALSRYFLEGESALRADRFGVVEGHESIDRFRSSRGGAPERTLGRVFARPVGPGRHLLISENREASGGLGVLTQLWNEVEPCRWVIEAAHVAGPSAAIDPTLWRVIGAPLVARAGDGPLQGLRVAVKDLYAVAGQRIGAGVPAHLEKARVEPENAAALQLLLDAGAEVTGIVQTDQFAYSISGRNPHYGTPVNPTVRGGLPGGSSSGPSVAVSLGQADIGLATDTAGSVRVPASYQGLWGLRTTHGNVPVDGLLPLAPSFDTVGWLTRDAETLTAVARQSLPNGADESPEHPDGAASGSTPMTAVIVPELVNSAEPEVREQFHRTVRRLVTGEVIGAVREVSIPDLPGLFDTFRLAQSAEAWAVHGRWIEEHPGAVVGDEADRFAQASQITEAAAEAARARLAERRAELASWLGDDVLVLPTAPSPAPDAHASGEDVQRFRVATLSMTCVATLMGRPGLSVPVMHTEGGPVGLCLVGPRHGDLALLATGAAAARVLTGPEGDS